VYNIGADATSTLNDLAAAVAGAMGVEPRVVHLAARHEAHNARATHEKIARVFGAQRTTPLDVGLAKMAAWAKTHGARSGAPFEGIEITRNLPPSWVRT
jgi:UDP-glucose 4-epimerase